MTHRHPIRALLAAQFLGAFDLNAWKLVVILLFTRVIEARGLAHDKAEAALQGATMQATIALALPLVVFSIPGGVFADRFSKRSVLIALKGLELTLLCAATAWLALRPGDMVGPLAVLALLGLQAALFSPAKYGILPEVVPREKLSFANGVLESWTFLAIIAGTVVGPLLARTSGERAWLAAGALAVLSLVGFAASLAIPRVPPAGSGGGVAHSARAAWQTVRADRALGLAIAGATAFWAIASLLGQDLLVYATSVLRLEESWRGVPFAVLGLGVGAGSLAAGRLSETKIELGLVPLGALGLGVFTLLFAVIAPALSGTVVLLALLGFSSGFLLVPLNALMQWRAPADRRGAVLALSNVFQFAGMAAGSLAGGLLALANVSARGILVAAALATLAGTAWALRVLPEALLRLVLFLWTHSVYRLAVIGRENVPATGGVLLAPNHVSFADGLFLLATVDRPIRFLVDEGQYRRPFVKPFMKLLGAIPIDASGETKGVLRALRDAGARLEAGEAVCIFPEGQITRTGMMQPFRRGLERIVKGRAAPVVPVHLDRVWGSIFSFTRGRFVRKLPERIPYPVTVSFGEPLPPETTVAHVRAAVEALGERAWYRRKAERRQLQRTFARAARRRPWRACLIDDQRGTLSRLRALAGAVAMARALRAEWRDETFAGVLLPPSVPAVLVNVAALFAGKPLVNLNYTAGRAGMESAARQASLGAVVTSRAFVERAKLELPGGVRPVFLEDAVERIGRMERVKALLLATFAPLSMLERACGAAAERPVGPDALDELATVIFSSGSTGEPKGVMLSHFNVDSNVEAVAQVFRIEENDRLLGILPLFHSFGFMSLWFSLNHGMPVVCHPNPLDAAAIGKRVEQHRVTMLLATPTFLQMYLRRCTPEQFASLRVVLVGAEKLTGSLAAAFEERFGIRPLEGYGTTECAPVVATSVPGYRAPGFYQRGARRDFVGPPVPGVTLRVVDPETFAPLPAGEAGMLLVRGPNVMVGYLGRPDLTDEVLRDGWYVTGDLARVDEDGFLQITDRLSRFSKIGGEMVPHGVVEEALHAAYAARFGRNGAADGERRFAVTSLADERKGERLAVLTTVAPEQVAPVLAGLQDPEPGKPALPNLFLPRRDAFVHVDAIPLLGSGKMDLRALKRIAAERLADA